MKIAVTGASGFVGGATCRLLVADGHQVHAFGRRSTVDPTHIGGAHYRAWDITTGPLSDPPDVDATVHCAGTVTDWGPPRGFHATNVTGTGNVLDSFPTARVVHVSTASVYDPRTATIMATEDQAPVRRYLNAYGASKAAAERLVLDAMTERPAIILRPHAVYGPGDTTLLPRVLAAVRGRWLIAIGDGRQRLSLTLVDNLARACALAATGPVDRGIFNVTDAEPVALDDVLRALLAARGIAARPIYLPERIMAPLAGALEALNARTGWRSPPKLTRYAVSHLAHERTLDITAARRDLGYDPSPTSLDGAHHW